MWHLFQVKSSKRFLCSIVNKIRVLFIYFTQHPKLLGIGYWVCEGKLFWHGVCFFSPFFVH